VYCGIYVREGRGSEVLDHLADLIAQVLHPAAVMPEVEKLAPLSRMRTKHSAA
jgi:hypothetical protein